MPLPKTITVRGCSHLDEFRAAEALSPGHILQRNSLGKVIKHLTEGGFGPLIVARENALYGKTTEDAYASGDLVMSAIPERGDVILARLAGSVSYAKSDKLISNGAGALKKLSAASSQTLGTKQVDTATVTAASGATSSGDLTVTVTSALLAAPEAVSVALVSGTHTTATLVATAIAAALQANSTLGARFTFTSSGATVIATAQLAAANDSTLNIAIAAGLGVSAAASSANTTAGVAPVLVQAVLGEIEEDIDASASASDQLGLVRIY